MNTSMTTPIASNLPSDTRKALFDELVARDAAAGRRSPQPGSAAPASTPDRAAILARAKRAIDNTTVMQARWARDEATRKRDAEARMAPLHRQTLARARAALAKADETLARSGPIVGKIKPGDDRESVEQVIASMSVPELRRVTHGLAKEYGADKAKLRKLERRLQLAEWDVEKAKMVRDAEERGRQQAFALIGATAQTA